MKQALILTIWAIVSFGFLDVKSADVPGEVHLRKAYSCQDRELYDSAAMAFDQAATFFRSTGDFARYAEALAGVNRNFLKTDRVDRVVEMANEVLSLAARGVLDTGMIYVAETHRHLARYCWYAKGDFPAALDHLASAEAIYGEMPSPDHDALISIYTDYGYTYGYAGDFEKSTEAFRKGLQYTIEVYGDNYENLGDRYTDLAFSYVQKSEWETAERLMKRAIELNIRHHGTEDISVLKCYNNLGFIYLEKFDSKQAIGYIDRAIELLRERYGEGHRSVGIGYMNLGASYYNGREYARSLHYSTKAAAHLIESVGDDNPYLATIYRNMANAYAGLDSTEKAVQHYQMALDLNLTLYGEKHPEVIRSYQYIADFYMKQSQYDMFREYNQRSIGLAAEVMPPKHKIVAENYLHEGVYHCRLGRLWHGLDSFQKAIYALAPAYDGVDPLYAPDPGEVLSTRVLIDVLIEKTSTLYDLYRRTGEDRFLIRAGSTAVATDRALDVLRADYRSPEAKGFLAGKASDFYEDAVAIQWELHMLDSSLQPLQLAFQYIEKSKSVLFMEAMTSYGKPGQLYGIPESVLAREQTLQQAIRFYQEKSHEAQIGGDTTRQHLYKGYLFEKKRDYDLFKDSLRQQFPSYVRLMQDIGVVDLVEVRRRLGPSAAFMDVFISDHSGFILLITRGNTLLLRVDVKNLTRECSDYLSSIRGRHTDAMAGYALYTKLFAPVKEVLKQESIDEVVVIPDGLLYYIPFESLLSTHPDRASEHRYLIRDYAFRYCHTARQYVDEPNPPAGDYLGFAPVFSMDSNPLLATRSADDRRLAEELQALPMAVREVKMASRLLRGMALTGRAATEARFKREAPSAGILHLASHAIIDDEEPLYSRLVLSSDAGSGEDGLLHTFELYNMKLQAHLACLSACNTGLGKIRSGQGVISLAKGFMVAGVPNVMMSLWSVPDRSTARIMNFFYNGLRKGYGKADALRDAKIKYLDEADENTADPYYWAALTLVGDNQPVEIGKSGAVRYALLGLMLVLLLGAFLMRKRLF